MSNLCIPTLAKNPLIFTRYLYEKTEVFHSLLFALLDGKREEALFWGYELYFSGFETELVEWIEWIYTTFYSSVDVRYYTSMVQNLQKMQTLPISEERDCLIGTVISNLSHRGYDIRTFGEKYMSLIIREILPITYDGKPRVFNHPIYIRFQPRDLAKYTTKSLVETGNNPRNYLECVCDFPIRKSESMFLRKYTGGVYDNISVTYLDNWLYHASHSPIWAERIFQYGGKVNHLDNTVSFCNDEEFERFYEEYGYEPDEQTNEMHIAHGIDAHSNSPFTELCSHDFMMNYSGENIYQYSSNTIFIRDFVSPENCGFTTSDRLRKSLNTLAI